MLREYTKREKALIIFNIIIVVSEVITFGLSIAYRGETWYAMFVYFTQCSNVLATVSAVIYLVYIRKLRRGMVEFPRWVRRFRFLTVSCLAMTNVTVVIALAPMSAFKYHMLGQSPFLGYLSIFMGGNLFTFHFLVPILAIIGMVFLDDDLGLTRWEMLIGAAPVAVYAMVSTILNVVNVIRGPYPFLYVHDNPIWVSVLSFLLSIGLGVLMAWTVWKLNKVVNDRRNTVHQ